MKGHVFGSENDQLRACFTAWITQTVKWARADYLKRMARRTELLVIDDPDEHFDMPYDEKFPSEDPEDAFAFENEILADKFEELSPSQKRILVMLYVQEKEPEQIAAELKCTVQHIYNQKHRALKALKTKIG